MTWYPECTDCGHLFATAKRQAIVCPMCSARRVRSVLAVNGDSGDERMVMVGLDGNVVNREVQHTVPGTWSGGIAAPVGTSRIRLRWWNR